MRLDLLLMCAIAFVGGMLATFLWMRGDVIHYKDLYTKVLAEKKKQQVEFNNRLDALARDLEVDPDYIHYGVSLSYSPDTEPSTASEEILDEEYR